jgi:ligand-binding sensor domain-containing protein
MKLSSVLATITLTCAMAASVPAQQIDWTILKPSNTGIPGDNCYDIYIDRDDRPWIPGFIPFWGEGGLARWDRDTNTWFSLNNVDYPVIPSPRIDDVDGDTAGIMWIATNEGLVRYDPTLGPASLEVYDASNSPMPNNWIRQLSIAPDGSLWLAISESTGPFGGLVRFDPMAQSWDVWTTANGLPWGAAWPGWDWVDFVTAAPDPDGGYTVWFGSVEMGLATYKNGVFTLIQDDPPPSGPIPWGLPGDDVVDDQGNLWLSTDQGLARHDPDDGSLTVVPLPPGVSGRVEAFSGGRVGLTTYHGDVWLYDGTWTFLGNGDVGIVYALAEEASTGALWVGGQQGAARLAHGTWQRYRVTNTGMVGYTVQAIDFDGQGNVYMNGNAGTNVGGFSIYDGERWTCVNNANYGGIDGLKQWDGANYTSLNPSWVTYEIEEDSLGRLWSGGWGHLFLYQESGGYLDFNTINSPMFDFFVRSIDADPIDPGFVWAATGVGVVRTDGSSWDAWPSALMGLSKEAILDVAPATDGTLWIAASNGLTWFDPVSLESQLYTTANSSLPANVVHHVVVTPDGSVWADTFGDTWPYPGGVTRFDGEIWTTWTKDDSPLPFNQIYELTWRTVEGGYEVWVGTAGNGVAVIKIADDPAPQIWTDLGLGLAGTHGVPSLAGSGALEPGTAVTLTVASALESAATTLVIGLSNVSAPFKGGVMVPNLDVLLPGLFTDGAGSLMLSATWPSGLPSGFSLFHQAWITDPAGPAGWAATNGLLSTTP